MGKHHSKNTKPGELSPTTVPGEEIKALAERFKANVEKELGRELDTFDAVSFREQIVAANVYFIKVNIGDEYAHIRIYDPIPNESSEKTAKFEGVQEGKTLEDDIVEFQEPSPCEELQASVEEAPEPPKQEPEKEEPKEEQKEEEPKKEEESKEEGGGLLDTVKAGASNVQEEGSSLLDTAKAGAASVGVSF